MKKASPLDYAFAVGKIRALEKFLIKEEVFEKAIESDLSEALRVFVESDLYSEELLHIKDSEHLETALDCELLKLKNLIRPLILDKDLLRLIELDTITCIKNILQNYPSEILEDYFRCLIDMHNIKTFLRLHILNEPPELLKRLLVCEGFIPKTVFLELYTGDLAAFLNKLEYVHKQNRVIDYAYHLREAIERIERENSFIALEKAINDFLIDVLRPAKYISFGPEPLFAYYFAKVNEINLIRMIILAKLNNLSSALAKQRLSSVYA
jgi:vacuolar-type H+-ATPase subunit C/Vma6